MIRILLFVLLSGCVTHFCPSSDIHVNGDAGPHDADLRLLP